MFMTTSGPAMNFAFPDVCNTIVGPATAPIPYPNISFSAVASPVVPTVTVACMPVVNMLSSDTISSGDEAGTIGGVVDATVMGETTYTTGAVTTTVACMPPAHLTSVTGQNSLGAVPNAIGASIVPSQVTVIVL